ncbi:hypothetical protein JW935_03305 [candidate division KSB1 bacterium]|nr:hypothetical protein [candidate division KSB1 bacterium]
MKKLLVISILIYFASDCCQSQVLSHEEIRENQTVKLVLHSGDKVSGKVVKVTADELIIVDAEGQAWRAKKNAIKSITAINSSLPSSQISTENSKIRNPRKVWIYSVSGGLLSLGTGFFASSMLSRGLDEDIRDPVIYGGTALTTLTGSFVFARLGARSSRVKKQKEGFSEELSKEQQKQTQLKEEIDKLKQERERQEAEKKDLLRKINEPNN